MDTLKALALKEGDFRMWPSRAAGERQWMAHGTDDGMIRKGKLAAVLMSQFVEANWGGPSLDGAMACLEANWENRTASFPLTIALAIQSSHQSGATRRMPKRKTGCGGAALNSGSEFRAGTRLFAPGFIVIADEYMRW